MSDGRLDSRLVVIQGDEARVLSASINYLLHCIYPGHDGHNFQNTYRVLAHRPFCAQRLTGAKACSLPEITFIIRPSPLATLQRGMNSTSLPVLN